MEYVNVIEVVEYGDDVIGRIEDVNEDCDPRYVHLDKEYRLDIGEMEDIVGKMKDIANGDRK